MAETDSHDQARDRLEAERVRVTEMVSGLRSEQERDLTTLASLEAELSELEAALERIDNGTYDERTGEHIDPQRLAARPEARTNDANGQ